MLTRLTLFLVLILLTACSSGEAPPDAPRERDVGPQSRPDVDPVAGPTLNMASQSERMLLEIDSETSTCTGVGEQQCLKIRAPGEEEWRLFYDSIEGFVFEAGFRSVVEVERTRVEDPPADASSLRYRLLRIVSREPAS